MGGSATSAGQGRTSGIHQVLDRLAERWADGAYEAEAIRARSEYLERGGKVFDDDAELFEARMASFLEWYLIERPFDGGPPPVVRVLQDRDRQPELSDAERLDVARIAGSHRSLFDLVGLSGGVVELVDVIGGARFHVIERRGTRAFEVGDLFESRLVWDGQHVVFAKTFLFHPQDAREATLRGVEAALDKGVPRDEILFQMSRHHVRWHRLGHVGAARIYRGEGG